MGRPVPDDREYTVSIVQCPDYELHAVREAVQSCVKNIGGFGAFVRSGSRVLIKPNLLSAHPPGDAVTTHPSVLRAVIELVQDAGGCPVVGDSPGGRNTQASYRALLKVTGVQTVLDETGCPSVYFDAATIGIPAPDALTFKRFTVPKICTEVDAVITLPKLKTHQLTTFTGAVKLLYGYLPGILKAEYHLHAGMDVDQFADLLLDIAVTLPPTLSVMDGIVGMEGNGPSHGSPRTAGVVFASTSSMALDMVACRLIGFDNPFPPTVRRAAERGIGPGSLDQVRCAGATPADLGIGDWKRPDAPLYRHIPRPILTVARRVFAARPKVDTTACTRCGICALNCPSGAIRVSSARAPVISAQRCICCYCCQELCPSGAIRISQPLLRRMLGSIPEGRKV
ncbi:MAG: DUF362 domain-containing protein [Methanomicrobiales archaeon]|nr:DUF362 domain-containing protein [Methanomicrobiales archaeon]